MNITFRVLLLSISFCLLPIITSSKTVNVKRYGARGDGISNDIVAIQKAVNALSDGDVLLFPPGDYRVELEHNKASVILISGKTDITVKGRSARISLISNSFTHYNLIEICNSNNIKIKKLTLIGDRLSHDYKTVKSTHEFGYGIFIIGNALNAPVNVDISKCEIYNMTGDAIVTKNGVSTGKISIINCSLHHCRRQGISILDSDIVLVSKCQIHSIGCSDGIAGTAPMAGIDVEPGSGTRIVNHVFVSRTTISDCDYISIVGNPSILEIEDSKLEDISIHDNEFAHIHPSGYIRNSEFNSSSSRRHYFAVNGFKIKNSQIVWTPSDHSNYCEIWSDGIENCFIKGSQDVETGEFLLGCRSEINNSRLETVRIINANSRKMGRQNKNHYKNCFFLLYDSPEEVFEECIFDDCVSDARYQPKVTFKNCIFSRPFMKNQVIK